MRRIALALGLAILLPACGPSAAQPGALQAPAGAVEGAPAETSPPSTVPQSTGPTTAPAPAPTTARPAAGIEVAPYFLVEEAGHHRRSGPFLVPVARRVAPTQAVARAAMEGLLAGPDQGEREGVPALSTAIPDGVRLLGLTIEAGTATVDLSPEFGIGDDSAAVALRVAQVVLTLTRFDSVERVRILQDGKEAPVPTSGGSMVNGAVSQGDYLDFAAAIWVENPIYGGTAPDPLRVTGYAAVFEAAFAYALTDDDGLILEEGFASTSNGTGWGTFDFTIDYDVDREQLGSLLVWAHSAEDGSRIDVREYPVRLAP